MDSFYEPMEVSPASRNGDAWARIPSWDGDPRAYVDLEALGKRFEVDVKWRLAGEDCWQINYTVAAASSSDRRGPRGQGPGICLDLESAQPGLARDARGVQQQPIPRKEGVTKNSRVFCTLLLPRLARSAP